MTPWMSTYPMLGVKVLEQRTSETQILYSRLIHIVLDSVAISIFGFISYQIYVFWSHYDTEFSKKAYRIMMT